MLDRQLFNGICCARFPRSVIFDARPQLNATVNQLKGYGVERVTEYETVERVVCVGMDGIAMREQYEDLKKALIEF